MLKLTLCSLWVKLWACYCPVQQITNCFRFFNLIKKYKHCMAISGKVKVLQLISVISFSTVITSKKVNRKGQEEPQAEAAANPDTRRKRKVTQINVCIANKQMHDKHKD